jgi:hypothetical protein
MAKTNPMDAGLELYQPREGFWRPNTRKPLIRDTAETMMEVQEYQPPEAEAGQPGEPGGGAGRARGGIPGREGGPRRREGAGLLPLAQHPAHPSLHERRYGRGRLRAGVGHRREPGEALMGDVNVTLPRPEYEALMGVIRQMRPDSAGGGRTLQLADFQAAIDRLEAAGRRPLSFA